MDAAANSFTPNACHGAGHTRYRRDIDGLRSIAVLGVVLYHFGIRGFGGGYVGVDVFFVISGFLIGRSIISDMQAKTYSLIGFYERRIRRLYPAFLFVAGVCAVSFYALLLPLELKAFGRSLVAAVIYMSNVAFYKDRGYFDASASDKPLLHTWSLSVEEQFYIIFPLIVYLTMRWRPAHLPLVILGLMILSLGAAQFTLSRNADAVFYLFPFRAWELLAGVALNSITNHEPPPWIARAREGLGVAGLALIIAPIAFYTHNTPFPAFAAVPPCVGSAMIILAGTGGTCITNRLLATTIPVFIGLVSYSFYLWHWPVLVAVNYYYGKLDAWVSAVGIAASFALATLSWRFIEQPPRRAGFLSRKALFSLAALLSLSVGGVGFYFYIMNGLPSRFERERLPLINAEQDFIQKGGVCFDPENSVYPGLSYCRLGAIHAAPSFLVWADSHGRAYRDGIDQLARELGYAGVLVWAGGCPPFFDTGKREIFDPVPEAFECRSQNEKLPTLLARTKSLKSVILIGRWAYYTEGRGIGRDVQNRIILLGPSKREPGSVSEQRNLFAERMGQTADKLRRAGLAVYVLEQTPEFPQSNAGLIARGLMNGRLTDNDARRMTSVSRSNVELRQRAAQDVLVQLSKEGRIHIIRTHSLFCGPIECSAWKDDAPALFDNNHVTVTTSRRVRTIFSKALTP